MLETNRDFFFLTLQYFWRYVIAGVNDSIRSRLTVNISVILLPFIVSNSRYHIGIQSPEGRSGASTDVLLSEKPTASQKPTHPPAGIHLIGQSYAMPPFQEQRKLGKEMFGFIS